MRTALFSLCLLLIPAPATPAEVANAPAEAPGEVANASGEARGEMANASAEARGEVANASGEAANPSDEAADPAGVTDTAAAGGAHGGSQAGDASRAKGAPGPAAVPMPPRAALTVERCAACHAPVVAEWKAAMHARSTLETNPLYRTLHAMAVETKPALGDTCRNCHYAPWWKDAVSRGVQPQGVTCTVCHPVDPAHPKKPGGAVTDAQALCLGCHETMRTPDGRPVCTTGPEHRAADAGPCTGCHMPQVDGAAFPGGPSTHKSHRFPGGHVASMVQQAARLDVGISDGQVRVTVTPGALGHAFPTGTPMRYGLLRVTVLGADDTVLWQNVEGPAPPFGRPEALFMRVFSDGEGNRPVPPFRSKGPSEDHRLSPGTPRTVEYALPDGARRVKAVLEYRLGPPPLLKRARVPEDWRTPVTVAEAEAAVPES